MGNRRRTGHLSSIMSLFFKSRNPKPLCPSPWPWPSCTQPRTLSFRLTNYEEEEQVVRDISSLDSTHYSLSSVESESPSAASDCSVKAAMRAMSSNRLTFDGGNERSLSMSTGGIWGGKDVRVPFEGSVAVEMESDDLYRDFRVSMREMAEASGEEIKRKELVWFEEMLAWYLRMNKKWTHEFIVGAYWDLLSDVQPMGSSRCSSSASFNSPAPSSSYCASTCSSLSNSYVSCLSEIEEADEEGEKEGNSQITVS